MANSVKHTGWYQGEVTRLADHGNGMDVLMSESVVSGFQRSNPSPPQGKCLVEGDHRGQRKQIASRKHSYGGKTPGVTTRAEEKKFLRVRQLSMLVDRKLPLAEPRQKHRQRTRTSNAP